MCSPSLPPSLPPPPLPPPSLSLYFSSHIISTDTTREAHTDEDPHSFYFVREDDMRADIMRHKFIEFGKHQQHLYGIKADSVVDVIESGKMCIMDVHPQVHRPYQLYTYYVCMIYYYTCRLSSCCVLLDFVLLLSSSKLPHPKVSVNSTTLPELTISKDTPCCL